MDEDLIPLPAGPPPLLSETQMIHLAQHGWLHLTLAEELANTAGDLFRCSTHFFNLQPDNKASFYPTKTATEFGYYAVPDEKEYLTFRCRVHTAPHSQSHVFSNVRALEDTTAKAWEQAALVLFRILGDLARWSGLDPAVWNDILDGTLTLPDSEDEASYTLMRLFRYLPTTGFADAHTDLGLLTMCIGNRRGLEVLDRIASTEDKEVWVDPASSTRTATILVGQTLRALSEGAFNAGIHRVVGNPEGRSSLVFALRHSSRHDVDFGLFGGDGRVKASELWKVLKVGKVNINRVKGARDAQRAQFEVERSQEQIAGAYHNPGHG